MIYKSFAQGAGAAQAYSQNTVGYTKITIKPGNNLISAQFVPVSKNSIDDLTAVLDATNLPGANPDTGVGVARLQKWTGLGYTTYEWAGDILADEWEWPETENQWMTVLSADIASVKLEKTDGVWLNLANSQEDPITIISYGEVFKDPVSKELRVGNNLLSNPYPVKINLQDLAVLSGVPGANPDNGIGMVRLQLWTGLGYSTFEWAGDTLADEWEWPETENKWMTVLSADIATGVIIKENQGFWVSLNALGEYDNPTISFNPPSGL